jgi:hypothetical protein
VEPAEVEMPFEVRSSNRGPPGVSIPARIPGSTVRLKVSVEVILTRPGAGAAPPCISRPTVAIAASASRAASITRIRSGGIV